MNVLNVEKNMRKIDIKYLFETKYWQFLWIFLVLGYNTFFYYINGIQEISKDLLVLSAIFYFVAQIYRDDFFISKDRIPWVTIIYGLFLLWMFFSRYWGEMPNLNSIVIYVERHFILPIALALDFIIDSREKNNRALEAFVYAMTICAIVATVTTPVSSWGDADSYGGITPLQRNMASMIFVIAFAISLYCYSLKPKIIYIICDIILIVANVITGSRKGIIQFALVIIIYMLLNNSFKSLFKYLMIIALSVAIVAILFYKIPWLQEMFGQRFLAVFDDSIEDGSRDIRKIFRELAYQEFLKHPIIGNGYESFPLTNLAYTGIKVYSHCNYTELLSNYGVVGFALYYNTYAISLIIGIRNIHDRLGKMIIYTLVPAIFIEYGQVDYYSLHSFISLAMVFFSAKILLIKQKECSLQ